MARKKSSNLYIIMGATFAVVAVVSAIVVGLLVHAASEEDDEPSSSETSSVESDSSSEPEESDADDGPAGPAGPLIPEFDDDPNEDDENNDPDDDPDSDESSNSEEISSSAVPESSSKAPVSSTAPAPSKSSTAPKPSSSVAPSSKSSTAPPKSSAVQPAPSSSKSSTVSVAAPSKSSSKASSSSKGVITIGKSSSSSSKAPIVSSSSNKTGTRLDTPVIQASSTNGRIKISWDEVSHASGYKISIYEGDVDENSSKSPVETATLDGDVTAYISDDVSVVNDETYTVKVQALGSGNYYDSYLRRAKVTGKGGSNGGGVGGLTKRIAAPKNLVSDLDDDTLTISWDDVDDATSYTVELYSPSNKLLESETTSKNSYTFEEPLDQKGSYKAQVQANPKSSSKNNPSTFTSKTIKVTSGSSGGSSTRLAAPSFSIKRRSEYTTITWDEVKNAETYLIQVLDPSGIVQHEQELSSYENPYDWYGDMIKKGTWKIRMKAIDDDGEYDDSSYTTKSLEVSSGELEIPDNIDVDVNGTTATVSFSAVDDATFYQISLNGKNYMHEPRGISANRGTQSKKINSLKPGSYEVKVRACTDDDSLDNSEWSSSVSFRID